MSGCATLPAIEFILIQGAKLNGVDTQAWLTNTPGGIADHNIHHLDELLAWNYLSGE